MVHVDLWQQHLLPDFFSFLAERALEKKAKFKSM